LPKVLPLLPRPVAEARLVLEECGLRSPRDIDVEVIAAHYGAMVDYRRLVTAAGVIARTSRRAVIQVAEKDRGLGRGRFTLLHELAHHRLHDVVDHFAQCDGGARVVRGRSWWARQEVEREANHFSTEILMPELWAALLCQAARPTLDDVDRLARNFRVSLRASAIRYVELSKAPCALVHSIAGRVKRSTETAPFPGTIVETDDLHAASLAASLQNARAGASGEPREVPGVAWGDATGAPFVEHAIALGPDIGVLSWLVPAA
jgi:Zn-dependent peptidase ImmA (M78 family)